MFTGCCGLIKKKNRTIKKSSMKVRTCAAAEVACMDMTLGSPPPYVSLELKGGQSSVYSAPSKTKHSKTENKVGVFCTHSRRPKLSQCVASLLIHFSTLRKSLSFFVYSAIKDFCTVYMPLSAYYVCMVVTLYNKS